MEHVNFEHSTPVLRVENMQTSLDYYVGRLGFTNAEWGGDDFTYVSRDGAGLYLSVGDQGNGRAWVWIGIDDAARFHSQCLAQDIPIRMPPTNYPWALEMQLEDPDGNVLRLGSEPLPEPA